MRHSINFIHPDRNGTTRYNLGRICNLCHAIKQCADTAKYNEAERIKRLNKKGEELKSGIRKICPKCKKAQLAKNINENGICKVCVKLSIKFSNMMGEEQQIRMNTKEIRELRLKNFNTSNEEKAKKQEELDKKIAEFLKKQEANLS